MPFVLDNDAFTCWTKNKPWDVNVWRKMLEAVDRTLLRPLWAAVPDVVANREATLANWPIYRDEIKSRGWAAAFCVQDGMTPDDVPQDADVVFIGGSDKWKFPIAVPMFAGQFLRIHCARVNPIDRIELCEQMGFESVDGTGWFRDPTRKDKLPAIRKFIEGKRYYKQRMETPMFEFA